MIPPGSEAEPLLLVDDNPTNLQLLYQTLEQLGHTLLVARNGEDAIKIARQARPAVILLDVMMPGIDGFETCRRLQADPETRDIAIIFLSALDEARNKLEGLWLGAVDYITKPFRAEEVIARVENQLTVQGLKRQLAERNRQLEAANQNILETVAEGIYGLDTEGRISFANPAALAICGYTLEQALGQPLHKLHLRTRWDGSAYPFELTPIYPCLARGETTESEEDVFWRADGTPFPVALTCAPLIEADKVRGAVVAFQDISERKRQERELRQALEEVEGLKERLQAENRYLRAEVASEGGFGGIVGESRALRDVLTQIRQVAATDSTVLIWGESGTGKEALARAVHDLSPRGERPLIKVNCGAISPTLIESELFGHEKGSFTGALKQRQGHFELANGGTIFLDEVGELPAEAQVKLLRVLQEHEFTRVGGEQTFKVDVRVIAATNRDLEQEVERGRFRTDLYYRLNVFPLNVPPLRERREDIPLLVEKFVQDQAGRLGRRLHPPSQDQLAALAAYQWPGNIRELQNLIERAAILAVDGRLDLRPPAGEPPAQPSQAGQPGARIVGAPGATLAENEANYIRRVLEHTNWTIAGKGGAAELLDLPPSTLRSRMKKLGIERGS